jgi:hypothetical protein
MPPYMSLFTSCEPQQSHVHFGPKAERLATSKCFPLYPNIDQLAEIADSSVSANIEHMDLSSRRREVLRRGKGCMRHRHV